MWRAGRVFVTHASLGAYATAVRLLAAGAVHGPAQARGPGQRPFGGPGAETSATQRKPRCPVELRTSWPWRAAGRYRRQ